MTDRNDHHTENSSDTRAALLRAARNGERTAMSALADWYTERNDPGNPDDFDNPVPPDEVLAAGFRILPHLCQISSAKLSAINAVLNWQTAPAVHSRPRRNANRTTRAQVIEEYLRRNCISEVWVRSDFLICGNRPGWEPDPEAYSVDVPHDGEDQTETAKRLLAFLGAAFPSDHLVVVSQFTYCLSGDPDLWAPWEHAVLLLRWDSPNVWGRSHPGVQSIKTVAD